MNVHVQELRTIMSGTSAALRAERQNCRGSSMIFWWFRYRDAHKMHLLKPSRHIETLWRMGLCFPIWHDNLHFSHHGAVAELCTRCVRDPKMAVESSPIVFFFFYKSYHQQHCLTLGATPPSSDKALNEAKSRTCQFLIGGLEHFLFVYTLGIITPTDFHIFQRGRSTTNQIS